MEEATIAIRPMSLDDYASVYALWLRTPGMGLNDVDDSREGIARYLRRNPDTSFVAVLGERIVGVILAGHDGRRGFLHHTAVAEEVQRRGIGSMLVTAAMDALKREGIHKTALVVFGRNERGNAFWEKCGFTTREDLVYRNRALTAITRIDT
ncbi:MAG: GNAT family N-acetyltransferase [Clostridiaceae bacterium]|nr:GNAT family N-acetyltransferase [Clostridiaceae bacterium]